jgi:hypothetical protein
MITLITSGLCGRRTKCDFLRKFLRAICTNRPLWHYLQDCCSVVGPVVPVDYTCVTTLKQVFGNRYVLSYCSAGDGRMMVLKAKKFAGNRTSAEKSTYPNHNCERESTMSSARLELIRDDALFTPACMSRSMPAALGGLLTQTALDDFCDKIDELLVLSHARTQAEYKSAMKGWCCFFVAYLFFPVVPVCILVSTLYLFDLSPTGSQFLRVGLYIACFVYFVIVWLCTQPDPDAKSSKEILQLIRYECEEMTRRTPFVSFHVAAGAINHIDVSISLSAPASGVITASNAIMDSNNSKIDESSSNHQPVGYCAQTVSKSTATNGDYQPLNDMV